MKTIHSFIAMLLLAGFATPASAQVSNDNEDGVYKVERPQARDYVQGQVLVKFKDASPVTVRKAAGRFQSTDCTSVNDVLKEFGIKDMEKLLPNEQPGRQLRKSRAYNGQTIREHDLSQLYLVETDADHAPQTMQLVERLNTLDEVEYAEPNYKVYLMDANIAASFAGNPYVSQQWYLDSYGVKQLWNKPIVNAKRPVIAIIDTGVDMTHPDIAPNLWTNQAEAEGEAAYDNDGNGFKGDVHGWDFINNTPNVRDFNMHGTHVAGIAAAANNGLGIVGANPQALIMPISVMQSDGTGDVATIVKGIDYAAKNGADVLNLSLGTYANSRAMRQALEKAYQTTVIVAAAGNDGICVNSPHHPKPCYGAAPMFPAAYSFVLGVQATQSNGSLAGFSNYDDDGNTFSSVTTLQDPDGFNYELKAPGTNMLSTIPGGKYKVLQGTSMASPLVAGAISALKMVKNYDTQEILWGDLLHTDNIAQAYAITARPAELDLMRILYRERKDISELDEDDYSGDGRIDAGETVSLYPVIRTTFGEASNIKMYLAMGDEFEDPNTVQIITDKDHKVDFGLHLDAYGKGVSLNPLQLKVGENVANGRHIKMKFIASCDETNTIYEGLFTMIVDNIEKIGGVSKGNIRLLGSKSYLVYEDLAIMEGDTLLIEPGTILLFEKNKGIASAGKLIINGTPEKPIKMDCLDGNDYWSIINSNDTVRYCIINKASFFIAPSTVFENCIFNHNAWSAITKVKKNTCNITDCSSPYTIGRSGSNNNYINNICDANNIGDTNQFDLNSNYINSLFIYKQYLFQVFSSLPKTFSYDQHPYYGSSKESIVRHIICEHGNCETMYNNWGWSTYGYVDLANMPTRPYAEPHGIVWKVCVNGKDAQDEYEDLAPLGVGKHKFEVYFNRPMNKAVAPQISFGVRDPWTQNAVAEDGCWNEDGTIYTAYKTITGKTKSDGVNRIYVYGAEDNEYFEIPYEKSRFNVMINAAGSMATGFAAEAQMGRVSLTWDNENNDFDDAMGFNIYRYGESYQKILPAGWRNGNYYSYPDTIMVADTVRINSEILDIETTEFTDYDVTPGETYYYYYKVLSTDLQEFDVSNVVAATPLTSTLGDANGSGDVDVADVITTVNQITGLEPKPFIFEAADMNADQLIDVLDVIGIIQKILNPEAGVKAMIEATATYTIEDGTLYVETPVALAGVQVQLSLTPDPSLALEVAEDLDGFEHTSAWLSDNDYLFLAYNMNGKTLSAGKHALLHIGNSKIAQIRLSDTEGHNVLAVGGDETRVNRIAESMTVPGIYDLQGRKLSADGEQESQLPKGVYIINGKKVVK